MSELKSREQLKPFCPVHHWRMSHDPGSSKVQPSYRCNFESCTLRYTVAEGYFEVGQASDDSSLLSELETVACQNNREHHPCIVGYAKESARRNATTFVPAQSQSTLLDFALSKR